MGEAGCWDGQLGSLIRASGIRNSPPKMPEDSCG